MRKVTIALSGVVVLLGLVVFAYAVQVEERKGDRIVITTDQYIVHWKVGAQMGYIAAYLEENGNSLIGPDNSRNLYHSSNYAGGWKDWGALQEWEIIEEKPTSATIKFVSHDAGTKQYTCVATYYDTVPFIKHEVTVENTGAAAVNSFESNHDPMFEPRMKIKGIQTSSDPIEHSVYWTADGFAALYGVEQGVKAWMDAGWNGQGRMSLNHDAVGKAIKKGASQTITYFVAFALGGEKEAKALADQVTTPVPEGQSVEPVGKLATMWGYLKRF